MDELIDIITPDGARTGRRRTKAEVHRDGEWHLTAHVWVVTPDRQVLLQKRSSAKENHPGLWDVSSAGHVSAGESVIEAAVRELEEELGLAVGTQDLVEIGTVRESAVLNNGTYRDNEIHSVFVLQREVDLTTLRLQESEVEAVELVRVSELIGRVRRGDATLVPHAEEFRLLLAFLDR